MSNPNFPLDTPITPLPWGWRFNFHWEHDGVEFQYRFTTRKMRYSGGERLRVEGFLEITKYRQVSGKFLWWNFSRHKKCWSVDCFCSDLLNETAITNSLVPAASRAGINLGDNLLACCARLINADLRPIRDEALAVREFRAGINLRIA